METKLTGVHLHVCGVVQVLPLAHAARTLDAAWLVVIYSLNRLVNRAIINGRGLRGHALRLCNYIVRVRSAVCDGRSDTAST